MPDLGKRRPAGGHRIKEPDDRQPQASVVLPPSPGHKVRVLLDGFVIDFESLLEPLPRLHPHLLVSPRGFIKRLLGSHQFGVGGSVLLLRLFQAFDGHESYFRLARRRAMSLALERIGVRDAYLPVLYERVNGAV